jgi:hypothetical protein
MVSDFFPVVRTMTGSPGGKKGLELAQNYGDLISHDKEINYRNLKYVNVKETEFETALNCS